MALADGYLKISQPALAIQARLRARYCAVQMCAQLEEDDNYVVRIDTPRMMHKPLVVVCP